MFKSFHNIHTRPYIMFIVFTKKKNATRKKANDSRNKGYFVILNNARQI